MEESASEQSRCWYCGRPSDQLSAVPWPIHRRLRPEPGDAYNVVRWQTAVVAVPRCPECARKRKLLTIVGAVLSSIYPVYFIIMTQTAPGTSAGSPRPLDWLLSIAGRLVVAAFMFTATMMLLAWPGRLVALVMRTRLIPVSQSLRDLRRQGWRPGSKPGNVRSVTPAK